MRRYLLLPLLALQTTAVFAGQPDPIPEPETLSLLAIAGVALAINVFRNRKK